MNVVPSIPGIDQLEDIEFWSTISKGVKVTDRPFSNDKSCYQISTAQNARLTRQVIEYGYFESPVFIDREETRKLREIIVNLHLRKIMPIFVAIYDEFWEFLYRLREFFTPILGENYRITPDFWAWYITPSDENKGWRPHRDATLVDGMARVDGRPMLCTVWIPLMDVETSNSCIYVLPKKYDAKFQNLIRKMSGAPSCGDVRMIPMDIDTLPRVRALPVREGALIGWDAPLLHWGSVSSKWAVEPRINIGIYIDSGDFPPHGLPFDETGIQHIPLDDPEYRIPFKTRLTIISNILATYIHKFDQQRESDEYLSEEVRQFYNKWKWNR